MRSLAALVAAVLAFVGCGDGDQLKKMSPLSEAAFMRGANQICIAERDMFAFAAPDFSNAVTPTDFETVWKANGVVIARGTDQLEELIPPRSDRALVASWLKARRQVARLYRVNAAQAFATGDAALQRAVGEEIRAKAARADAASDRLKLRRHCSHLRPPEKLSDIVIPPS